MVWCHRPFKCPKGLVTPDDCRTDHLSFSTINFQTFNFPCQNFVMSKTPKLFLARILCYTVCVCIRTFPLAYFQFWSNYQVQIDIEYTVLQFLIALLLLIHDIWWHLVLSSCMCKTCVHTYAYTTYVYLIGKW